MNIENQDGLTPKQSKLIVLLLSKSITDAAKEMKLGRRTIYGWLGTEAFRTALENARAEVFSEGMNRIKGNLSEAVDVIVELMRVAEKDDSRIRAASIVIENARWLKTSEDFERRIEQLEMAVGRGR